MTLYRLDAAMVSDICRQILDNCRPKPLVRGEPVEVDVINEMTAAAIPTR